MNVRDSEVICGLLKKEGYKITDESEKANIVIFNTCSVRQHAEDKVWSEIGRIGKLRIPGYPDIRISGRPIIGVVGCMAQNYKEKIFERAPEVDFVVGPSDIHKIPEILTKVRSQESGVRSRCLLELKIWETDGNIRPEEIYHTGFYEDKNHAYVVISEGCSNFCSYCVVPYVRGPLRNRNYKDILKEIEEAVGEGISKITLLGQNVNAYEFGVRLPTGQTGSSQFRVDFIKLLRTVNNIKGLEEFSFITSHPKDTSVDLFKAMNNLDKLKKDLHLPVQSGSDRILGLMNRGYNRKFYLDLIQNYRKIIKDGRLTTDIIVGFPGETEEDFRDTYNLVKNVEFNAAYIFKYSGRPNTKAVALADDVPVKEKERRHKIILDLQKGISNKKKCHKK
jgi:tRNA-2-methylthio-N6-dimethylallyladenosine synthase